MWHGSFTDVDPWASDDPADDLGRHRSVGELEAKPSPELPTHRGEVGRFLPWVAT